MEHDVKVAEAALEAAHAGVRAAICQHDRDLDRLAEIDAHLERLRREIRVELHRARAEAIARYGSAGATLVGTPTTAALREEVARLQREADGLRSLIRTPRVRDAEGRRNLARVDLWRVQGATAPLS